MKIKSAIIFLVVLTSIRTQSNYLLELSKNNSCMKDAMNQLDIIKVSYDLTVCFFKNSGVIVEQTIQEFNSRTWKTFIEFYLHTQQLIQYDYFQKQQEYQLSLIKVMFQNFQNMKLTQQQKQINICREEEIATLLRIQEQIQQIEVILKNDKDILNDLEATFNKRIKQSQEQESKINESLLITQEKVIYYANEVNFFSQFIQDYIWIAQTLLDLIQNRNDLLNLILKYIGRSLWLLLFNFESKKLFYIIIIFIGFLGLEITLLTFNQALLIEMENNINYLFAFSIIMIIFLVKQSKVNEQYKSILRIKKISDILRTDQLKDLIQEAIRESYQQ